MHFVAIAVFIVWFVGGVGFKLARIASEEKAEDLKKNVP